MQYSTSEAIAPKLGQSFKHDLLASIVVFLVALPLCMGIAIASGVPSEKAAAVGIITGIVGGLVVGFLAGSPLQVSGPAAGLSVLVFELGQQHAWGTVGIIVLVAGAIQLVAGVLRLGRLFRAVSPAVINGMLAGIGVLIFASQFHVMVDDAPRGSGLANLVSIPKAVWKSLQFDGSAHYWAALTGLATIVTIVLWNSMPWSRLRAVPGPLVAVVVATALAEFCRFPIQRVSLPDNLLAAVETPTQESLWGILDWSILLAGLSLAFVASAETLLCAAAVDRMHKGPRTRYDRELIAQGVGNTVCGLLGALPITGVIVRSSANVQAGARTRVSAILHGLWLLLFVTALPAVLERIPTASLAAILVFTGYKLVNWKVAQKLWGYGASEVLIWATTLLTIVVVDLLTGVLIGIALSAAKLLYTFSHLVVRVSDEPDLRRATIYLEGTATFVSLPKLAAAIESLPHDRELHVRFDRLAYIDHACLELLMYWQEQYTAAGGSLTIDWKSVEARFRQPALFPDAGQLERVGAQPQLHNLLSGRRSEKHLTRQ